MRTQNHGDYVLKFKDDSKTKEKILKAILDFLNKHECFTGECLCQSDGPQVEAITLISDIADDILCTQVIWHDDE